ncbi:hypothetical protein EV356DRAFT_514199 [Viridothelium virens]|uniref:Uncharacterized protein n=1 Tax=Viridothelium virens TaxID=1048519 RepID=A0A6A6GSE3_VIRVR|nr:hypothetical protein EV356DRAFT_514199 [Viridothelium virens]
MPGLSTTIHAIRLWTEMLERAGLKLSEYGARESTLWEALGVNCLSMSDSGDLDWSPRIKVEQLVYGSKSVDWSLKISRFRKFPVFELCQMPGALPAHSYLPDKLIWLPTRNEDHEGCWAVAESKMLAHEASDLREMVFNSGEPFTELVDKVQDDHSVIMQMQYRASYTRKPRKRANSQPPCLRRREVAYNEELWSHNRLWLPSFHLCPFDSKWNFGCVSFLDENYTSQEAFQENTLRNVFHIRSCVNGVRGQCSSVQESDSWQRYSFLALITECQAIKGNWKFPRKAACIRRTVTGSCPVDCGKAYMDRHHIYLCPTIWRD